MNRQEILDFWGEENLVQWPEASLTSAAISPSCKSFLVEVGLPRYEGWSLRFGPLQPELPSSLSLNGTHYLLIGFDYHVPIYLDQSNGQVVSEHEGQPPILVNSNIELFAACLVLYQRYRLTVQRIDDDDEEGIQNLVAKVEQQMRETDPTAFKDPNDWWPTIIEQMRDGLL